MKIGKLIFGVCLGILLASAILGGAYYVTVIVPQRQAEAHQAKLAFDAGTAAMEADARRLDAANAELEKQIRAASPHSPCNRLTGSDFSNCSALNTRREQLAFVRSRHP